MAESSWPDPAASRVVDDRQYEILAERFSGDGLYWSPGDPAPVYGNSSGMQVLVRADLHGSVHGHGWASGDSDVVLAIGENASGSTRVDRVVLRLDRSDWTVRSAVVAGTPGAGSPALTRQTGDTGVWEIHLALVTVPNGAATITAGNVVAHTVPVGSRVRPHHSAGRNPYPLTGEVAFAHDLGQWEGWDGSAWTGLVPQSGPTIINSAVSGWSQPVDAIVDRYGRVVTLRYGTVQRTGSTVGSGESRLPGIVPAELRPPSREQYATTAGGSEGRRITVYPTNDPNGRAGQIWATNGSSIASSSFLLGFNVTWMV